MYTVRPVVAPSESLYVKSSLCLHTSSDGRLTTSHRSPFHLASLPTLANQFSNEIYWRVVESVQFQFGKMKKLWRRVVVMAAQQCATELYTWKKGKMRIPAKVEA